jgi:hypothetical protein
MNVLLQVRYSDNPEDIGTGGKAIQFVLKPQVCLRLAEELKTQADRILQDRDKRPN